MKFDTKFDTFYWEAEQNDHQKVEEEETANFQNSPEKEEEM